MSDRQMGGDGGAEGERQRERDCHILPDKGGKRMMPFFNCGKTVSHVHQTVFEALVNQIEVVIKLISTRAVLHTRPAGHSGH